MLTVDAAIGTICSWSRPSPIGKAFGCRPRSEFFSSTLVSIMLTLASNIETVRVDGDIDVVSVVVAFVITVFVVVVVNVVTGNVDVVAAVTIGGFFVEDSRCIASAAVCEESESRATVDVVGGAIETDIGLYVIILPSGYISSAMNAYVSLPGCGG